MAQKIAERRDIDFVLYEQLAAQRLTGYEKFSTFNKNMFDMIISEARTLSLKEILPTSREGDSHGVRFEEGKVSVPPCYHRPHRILAEGGWTSMNASSRWGGQDLPEVINRAALNYFWGANYCLANYGTLGHGTAFMIEHFGTESLKEMFLAKLYRGEWGGTMVLTEPQAGSDVGALTTRAVKNPDGTYSITGSKIFITNGEHDLAENIVHPVLARIDGSPPGTRGISIFIVPKIWVNDDGTPAEPNDVVCAGVEEKMGIHSSATCTMSLGEKGCCRGYLLGEENQGMKIMFYMMNEARLNVGFHAYCFASTAYLHAADYAKQRIQGKDMLAAKDAPSVAIINHPDVRRMLIWMKAHVEGMRSFVYYVYSLFDHLAGQPDGDDRERYQDLIDFFTPLVKAYLSPKSFEVCVQAMQVYGGYGYTKECPVEQLLRDCKIATIYEGTDGIQAMDLLGRKMQLKQGRLFEHFVSEVRGTITEAKGEPGLGALADALAIALEALGQVGRKLVQNASTNNQREAFVQAYPFLESTGDVIMAWMLLWRACVASKALAAKPARKDLAYYEGMKQTAAYYINSLLPATLGKIDGINNLNSAPVVIAESCFG